MEKTTLYLPVELQRSLAVTAKREGRPQAEIVRDALTLYFSRTAPLRLHSIGTGSDDQVTGATSEDWLRRNWGKQSRKKRRQSS
jgi:hypothetical protein